MRGPVILFLVVGLLGNVHAEEVDPRPLPKPLTLAAALMVADREHPALNGARARVESARAGVAEAGAPAGWRAGTEARLGVVGPPGEYYDRESREDHHARLYLARTLSDFGRTDAARAEAEARHGAARERLLSARQERRLTIMRHYFDVVLADMEYNRANEHMAIVFVGLDRVRDRHELGQVSDVELAEREATYQQALSDRNRAQLNRRAARNQLAATLNQPGSPPDRVRPPPLPVLEREPPPLDELRQAVRDDNPELLALRREVEARQAAVRAADRSNSPRLDVELAGHVWSENMRSSNDWEAALRLEVPFYQGGARSAARDGARARLREARARLREMEMALDQAVLEAWMELDNLAADRDAADSRRDYREQYLAYSRSLYQMELAADLGDAMVELTAAQKRQAEAAFNIAMTWARIDALQGLMPGPGREGEKP